MPHKKTRNSGTLRHCGYCGKHGYGLKYRGDDYYHKRCGDWVAYIEDAISGLPKYATPEGIQYVAIQNNL